MTRFMTTRWTLIVAARSDDDRAREALTDLCQAYWRPVYAYIRRHGRTPEQAADLTQSFFLHILENRGFERADPARGRFRSFLLTSARNFLANAREHDMTERRGGRSSHVSIDLVDTERHLAGDAADPQYSPEAAFERQWAIQLMERAQRNEDMVKSPTQPLKNFLARLMSSHWTPILVDDLAARALERIEAINLRLEAVDPGRTIRHSDIALYFAYLARATHTKRYERLAETWLERAAAAAESSHLGWGLHGGVAGLAWTMEHVSALLAGEVISTDADDINSDIDEVMVSAVQQRPWLRDYDLRSGLVGVGV